MRRARSRVGNFDPVAECCWRAKAAAWLGPRGGSPTARAAATAGGGGVDGVGAAAVAAATAGC